MIRPSTSWLCFYLTDNLNTSIVETRTAASGRSAPNINEVQNRIKEILNKYRNGIWVSKMSQIYQEMYWDELSTAVLSQLEHWPHICTVSIECHFCGRCQYPSDFTAHLPNVILGSLAFSFKICSCCFFLFCFFKMSLEQHPKSHSLLVWHCFGEERSAFVASWHKCSVLLGFHL